MSGENINTYRSFLVQTAERREAVIRSTFNEAFGSVNEFAGQPVTYQLLYNALVFRSTTSATTATTRLSSLLNTPGQNLFEAAWLLNRAGVAIASSTQTGVQLPFNNADRSTSLSYLEAERMAQEGELYKVVLEPSLEVGDETSVVMVTVIRDTGRRPIGYLVAEMNLDTLFYQHFTGEINGVEADGYIVLPSGESVLTSADNREDTSGISSSPPVLRALTGAPPALDSYTVQESDETEDVIGYAERLLITGTPFVLLTEMHVSEIVQQSRTYAQIAIFPVVVGGLLLAGTLFALFGQLITAPLNEMIAVLRAMGRGIQDVPLKATARQDEFGELARLLVDVRQQNAQATAALTQRLNTRERDVRVTQNIIQAVAEERDLQSLMNRVVVLIVANFPSIYHAQIFLTDTENYAVLRASTGEVGQQLMSRGHRLAIGSVSVIGQAVQQKQVIVTRDTSASDVHRRNEFLPDTRAELAIPLQINQEVIGALDVQSKERDAFTEEMITVMQKTKPITTPSFLSPNFSKPRVATHIAPPRGLSGSLVSHTVDAQVVPTPAISCRRSCRPLKSQPRKSPPITIPCKLRCW
ncbi:GAF domain-containing protein [bacterium]|nr:GAF domain-containing protein [bacterium]